MIVEFIGCTGAGKTTLIKDVQLNLAREVEVITAFDLVAGKFGLGGVTNPTARNVLQELIGFPFFLRSLLKYKEFIGFILRMLLRQAKFNIFTINNLRSLERKIGVHEFILRNERDQIVLVDEGTLLSAHNVFVYNESIFTHEEITRFARLVPLPDAIIYVKATVDTLVKRSLARLDPPREMRSRNRDLIENFVNRAVTMFDQLILAENIQYRLLIVENQEFDERCNNPAIDQIIDFILKNKNFLAT